MKYKSNTFNYTHVSHKIYRFFVSQTPLADYHNRAIFISGKHCTDHCPALSGFHAVTQISDFAFLTVRIINYVYPCSAVVASL